jgi:hypothetical protein
MSLETPSEPNRPFSVVAGFLSYLVPGLGQISQGRTGKGVLFLVALLSLFHVGEAMGSWQNVYIPSDDNPEGQRSLNPLRSIFNQRWHYGGQFWIGVAAWPAILQYYGMPIPGRDALPFIANYQKQPHEEELNQFLVNSDKTPDLGWIYTVIAGMLNVLVIYDAYAGPAYGPRIPRPVKDNAPAPEVAPS